MTKMEAARILDPETRVEALAEIEYYHGFNGEAAKTDALIEACRIAASLLRAQQEQRKNEPLTLEELRGMDEEPVFIRQPENASGDWALVDLEYELCRTAKGGLAIFDTYGKNWLAYRRKPEEDSSREKNHPV